MSMIKFDKKDKKSSNGSNLVHIFEKDASSVNKRELNGSLYSWGQNNEGQVGTPVSNVKQLEIPGQKKMRIYYPKSLLTLKDTVILAVSCGHTHSMAITISRKVFAWGSNRSLQLGLGEDAPSQVYIPTLIPQLSNVKKVSCGTEHTVALDMSGKLYSWGQGEGGLLGHGDLNSVGTPKLIEELRKIEIESVECGGLHTVALSKTGACYAWGRGEGGQLGIPVEQLTHDKETNDLYLAFPKKIRGAIDGVQIVQVACGDAHSLALSKSGSVYGWGYTNSGQLGLGVTGETYDPKGPYGLQVREPALIEKLNHTKVTEIFAGSTFSLFLNDKKELFGCGLNDNNQLGIEKNVTRVNNLDNFRNAPQAKLHESGVPRKVECFTSMPILNVACGENHSMGVSDDGSFEVEGSFTK